MRILTKNEQVEKLRLKIKPFRFDYKKMVDLMKERGINQKHLAVLCEVTPAAIGKVMNGEGDYLPSVTTLGFMAAALGVTPNDLFNRD